MKQEHELHLDFCEECFQMTNHIGEECQKCKNKTNQIHDEFDDEDNYHIKY